VCYSVLQCVAVCCSVLQCLAVSCSVLQEEGEEWYHIYTNGANHVTGISTWSLSVVEINDVANCGCVCLLRCVAVYCSGLQYVLQSVQPSPYTCVRRVRLLISNCTRDLSCNILQHTATQITTCVRDQRCCCLCPLQCIAVYCSVLQCVAACNANWFVVFLFWSPRELRPTPKTKNTNQTPMTKNARPTPIIKNMNPTNAYNQECESTYGVAAISRLLKIIGLFCRIWNLL